MKIISGNITKETIINLTDHLDYTYKLWEETSKEFQKIYKKNNIEWFNVGCYHDLYKLDKEGLKELYINLNSLKRTNE